MSDSFTFYFNGKAITARPGQSLAAALTDAGQRVFRHTGKGSPRGLFCGMGVCQDCLVSVDGQTHQRACMTEAVKGAKVLSQESRPGLEFTDEADAEHAISSRDTKPRAVELQPDILIVGAGAGGLSAAVSAGRAGASVVILDERKVSGGQYFKQPSAGLALLDSQQAQGADLLAAARDSGARLYEGIEIWGAFSGPALFATSAAGDSLILRPRKLIVATGAYERPHMVPGWTLPGVMTTGAAQTLWRSYRSLPGKRIAVCGSGPLNLQVALELARGGAEVCLVAEAAAAPLRHPLAALALLFADLRLSLSGLAHLWGLYKHRVPVTYNAQLRNIAQGPGDSLRATFDCAGGSRTFELDALCMNNGFEPQNEILRLLGAEMQFDPTFGHLRCVRDSTMLSTVEDVYAVGDCCGLGGAPAAAAEGTIAGIMAASTCGYSTEGVAPDSEQVVTAARRSLDIARHFQSRLWTLHTPTPSPTEAIAEDTILCRCEEVTAGEFCASLNAGARHIGDLKNTLRVGMGSCQGRYCAPAAARMVAAANGKLLSDHSYFAPRVPIKPVSVDALLAAQEALDAKA